MSHAKIETVTKSVEAGIGVYLYGPAGTGKSYLAKQVAKRLNLDYYEASKIENVFDLIGFVDATSKYVWTAFAYAYIYGGLFFLDEFDASNSNAATAATSVQCTCSYREIEAIAKLLSLDIDVNEVFASIFGYLDSDDIKMLAAKLNGGGAFVEAFKRLAA